jgi:hypothetical protein
LPRTALVDKRVARPRDVLQPHAHVGQEDLVVRDGAQQRRAADDARVEVAQHLRPQLEGQRGEHLLAVVRLDLLLAVKVEHAVVVVVWRESEGGG